jgi:predicted ArsR family transcriptional regulator
MISTYPTEPGFKVTGPSQEAAASVREDAEILRMQCLEVLKRQDLTADEVADRLGKSVLSVRPRCSELNARHAIRDTGQRRKNLSGKSATVWTARELKQPELI